jgi:hypothetical protein
MSDDDFFLECIHDNPTEGKPRVRCYRIRRPGTLMESTILTEVAGDLTISGDLCPGNGGGVTSCLGYGLEFFGTPKSHDYLCSKFLRQDVHLDLLDEWHTELMADRAGAEELWGAFSDDEWERLGWLSAGDSYGPGGFLQGLADVSGRFFEDGPPGYGFDRHERRTLVMLHERFAKLWQARAALAPGATDTDTEVGAAAMVAVDALQQEKTR